MHGCITGWVFDICASAFIEYHDVIHDWSRLVLIFCWTQVGSGLIHVPYGVLLWLEVIGDVGVMLAFSMWSVKHFCSSACCFDQALYRNDRLHGDIVVGDVDLDWVYAVRAFGIREIKRGLIIRCE